MRAIAAPVRAVAAAMVLLVTAAGCAGAGAGAVTAEEPLLVAAAADLQPAFRVLGEEIEAATGERIVFSFGSSGQLAQQLIEGAPMDLYASANVSFVEQVLASGRGDPATQATYAYGRIVLWAQPGAWGGWEDADGLADLAGLADDDTITTIAIANPEHAPYGLAAKQAMEAVGVWEALQPTLVYGENVADTQRLAATGNADVAVIALSLALAADLDAQAADGDGGEGSGAGGEWRLIDDDLHTSLQQDLVVVADDPARAELAERFADHVLSETGREVMRRYGFLLPGEEPPATWQQR